MRRMFIITIFASAFIAPMAHGMDVSLNVQEMSHISQDTVGALWDISGWYDAQNEKYYVLTADPDHWNGGMAIVDATDPQNPIMLGKAYDHRVNEPKEFNDIKVIDDYVYVMGAAFSVNDTSYPAKIWIFHLPETVHYPSTTNPVRVLICIDDRSGQDTIPLCDAETIYANDDFLFVNELRSFGDSLYEVAVLSLANPAEPILLDVWSQIDFDAGVYGWPHSAYVKGITAYLFNYFSGVYQVEFSGSTGQILNWKKIWYDGQRGDVSDTLIDRNNRYFDCNTFPYDTIPREPFTHSGWLSENGDYIIVADEHPTGPHDCQDIFVPCLRIFDVNDFYVPQNPDTMTVHPVNAFDIVWDAASGWDQYIIGSSNIDLIPSTPCPIGDCIVPIPPDTFVGPEPNFMGMGIHDPFIKGRLAFIAWYERGLQVIDLRDIDNANHPIYHAGYYDHDTGANGSWHEEAFDVYPYSPDGYIYQGDGQGLYICRYGYTGSLDTNATWAGDIYLYDTLSVASNHRLSISAGTNIYMFKDALLKVNGKLVASGTSSDSVKFICLGGNPQPGDWRGIYVDQTAVCSLSYCSISNAEYGLESRNNAQITVLNSNFHDNEVSGIYSYKSYTKVKYSRFENNGTAGVDALDADVDVYGSRFVDNALYGIRLVGTWTTDSTLIEYDTLSCSPTPSQYAISITNIDRARVYKCKARSYTQAGLYLNGSDVLVRNNDFSVKKNVRKITFCLTNAGPLPY